MPDVSSETWTVGRTCERELEAAGMLYLLFVARVRKGAAK
jgi:hypothetical protein